MSPFEQMEGHNARGEAYTLKLVLKSGYPMQNMAVLKIRPRWLQLRSVDHELATPVWVNVDNIELVEIDLS